MANNKISGYALDSIASPISSFSCKFAKLCKWSALIFIGLFVLLHFIKPELEPSWHFISEYQIGRFGWMMSLAFLSLAVSCLALTVALWPNFNILGRIGLLLLVVTATGMIIAAIFISDPLNAAEESEHGRLHQLGAMLDSIPVASILITIGLIHKNNAWRSVKRLLIWSVIMVWMGSILFIASMALLFPADGKFGPDVTLGWQNRVMITVQCLWLIIVANQIIKINGGIARPQFSGQ
jgi:hypothetical protein